MSEVLFEVRGRAGLITLNRPAALNALNLDMVREITPRLKDWATDDRVRHVVIGGAGEKAFCAGGDIRQLRDWGMAKDPLAIAFYREEYRLNTLIKRYAKPYIAVIDGIVMGGGVGLSVHGSRRIGGPRTMFAMPETGIGLFPDVGGSYFLPRLPGETGTYLSLTGARLGQADAHWSGVLTHAALSADLPGIVDRLCEAESADAVLAPNAKQAESGLAKQQSVIDRCFSGATVEEILARLDAESGADAEFAHKTAATIRTKSPTSLKLTLRQMREGKTLDFEDCMRMEFRMVCRAIEGHEFFEGVRAVIVDKDNKPVWKPSRLEEVSDAEIGKYFAPLGEELTFQK